MGLLPSIPGLDTEESRVAHRRSVCIYIYIYIYIYTHINKYISLSLHVYIYIYIHIHISFVVFFLLFVRFLLLV